MIAGEASGDLHGASLARAIRAIDPQIEMYGVGGIKMREAGLEIFYDCKDLAVMGIVEAVKGLLTYLRTYWGLKRLLVENRPDLVVLIDFPEFNLRFASAVRRAGIPIVYYICPQVWGWRPGRVKKLARLADRLLVIFPFEVEFYRRAGIAAEYVGNPVAEVVHPALSREEALTLFGLKGGGTIIGLLPGSRRSEVSRILPRMLKTAELLMGHLRSVDFLLLLAPTIEYEYVDTLLKRSNVPVKVIDKFHYDAISICNLVIATAGTATLEASLLATPMVMVYAVSPITYALGIKLLNVKDYSLANLILGKRVVPELTQGEFTPERTAREVIRLLEDRGLYLRSVEELRRVRDILGEGNASHRAAQIICQMVEER